MESSLPEAGSQDLQSRVLRNLRAIRDSINREFPGADARLDQFSHYVDTTIMTVEHLFDEAERMPERGYRKTPEQKTQEMIERQRVVDQMRKEGATI